MYIETSRQFKKRRYLTKHYGKDTCEELMWNEVYKKRVPEHLQSEYDEVVDQLQTLMNAIPKHRVSMFDFLFHRPDRFLQKSRQHYDKVNELENRKYEIERIEEAST